ncbi:hypothetical protein [Tropicibacter sp. S64]|uniref:hypothetical protein n=1 Tax=Tropicibacter sp. S64 TaxID=3415122 RepID=UPI003C7D1490
MTGYIAARCLAPAGAEAGGAQVPDVRLDCRLPQAAGLDPEALCAAMEQALAVLAPGLRVVRDAPGDPARLRLAVALTPLSDRGLSGQLAWDRGDTEGPQTGPEVRLQAMDSTLRPGMLPGFAQALLTSDPALLPVLQALADAPPGYAKP